MHWAPERLVAAAGVFVLLGVPTHAQVTPADEQAIRQLVTRVYDARQTKDVASFAALWSEKAPARPRPTFPPNLVFPYDRVDVTRVTLSRVKQAATAITCRVTADVTVTLTAIDKPRTQRWVRNMSFVKEADTWLLWREAPAADELAIEISRATSAGERDALLNSEPELATEELAFALESQGDRMFSLGNARGGLPLYEMEVKVGEQSKSQAALARGHLKIGQVLQLNPADKPSAVAHFEKALDAFSATGDRAHVASAEVGIATSFYMQDDVAARDHYQKAIAILETLPDRFVLANAVHGYGNACFMLGDYPAALGAYRRSMDLQASAGVRGSIGTLWQAIGRVQKKQGDYDTALESCRKSLAEAGTSDPATEFGTMLEIADVYRLQGRFELALDEYNQALALAQQLRDRQGEMRVEGDIGNVCLAEQQPSAALAHYQKSLDVAQQLSNQDGVARALAGLGTAHFSEMRNDAALDAFAKALAIREAAGDKGNMAWLHAHIGMVHSAIGKHDDALVSFRKALDLSAVLRDRAAVAVMEALLAAEEADLDHADEAVQLANRAAESARAIDNDDTFARARLIAGRVLRKKGDNAAATQALREAVAAVEAGRARAGDEPPEDFFGDTRGPYREMALLLAASDQDGRAAEALSYSEQAHIGLLADVLTGNRSLISDGLSAEEQEQEREVSRARKSLRTQVDKEMDRATPDAGRLESLKAKLAEVEQQRTALAERIYAAHPSLKLQRGLFDARTLADFVPLVADGRTLVVEYVTGEKQALAIVLATAGGPRPEGRTGQVGAGASNPRPGTGRALPGASATSATQLQAFPIDISLVDLSRKVREYRAAVRTRDDTISQPAQDLYETLVAPWASLLAGRTRVIVVPDGPLWSLPFQALQSSDGRYLIQRCAVSYAPSLTALTLVAGSSLTSGTGPRATRVLAIANPQPGSAAVRLQLLNAAASMAPMPNAEQEARRLSLVYGAGRTKQYSAAANRDAFDRDAGSASLLHLATYLVPSAASPLRSPIVFSVDKAGQADIVEAWEMMRVGLPRVAVVSRVQVDRVGADGQVPVGLSWVFFVAGVRTAVLATWPDDSAGALMVMSGLHRGLATAGSVPGAQSKALRQAILPMLATKYKHPFYWANYWVIGVD